MTAARVTEAHRTNFTVTIEKKEYIATVRGVFHSEGDFPKVGDYVDIVFLDEEKAVIERVHPRTSVIKREAANTDEEQIIAANVDIIFVVMGLDGDFNVSRLERYLLLARQSDVPAVVVLNKADIATDNATAVAEVTAISGDVPVHVVSAKTGQGMGLIQSHFQPQTTAVLLGSSGAGKSTITNWLLDAAVQAIADTRVADNRGRHTTTSRQLFALPKGGSLIDTPGMRELGVLESDADDELLVFERIESFASQCQFRNCDHEKSAGCAVQLALDSGEITEREFHNYNKILREREFHNTKGVDNSARHFKQNEKRQQQKDEAGRRQRLSRR